MTQASTRRLHLPVIAPSRRTPTPRPHMPSWRDLWSRLAASGTILIFVMFAGYELLERALLSELSADVLSRLHILRGAGSAVLVGTWCFYFVMRARRYYDEALARAVDELEAEVHERTDELERSQAFLEHLFDSLKDRVIVTDREGRVVKANRVARESAGIALEGRVCSDVFSECTGRCAVLSCDERGGGAVVRSDPRNGRIWAMDTYPLPSIDRESDLVLEVGRDVTDERRLEAQMRHQEKMASLGILASGIAHDIGNPLASLSSELEMLEHEDDVSAMRGSLGVLRTHVDRIARTLREMVDFARRRGDDVTDVGIATALDDALRLVGHDRRMRDVTVTTDVPRDLPAVRMVEDHLVMVIVNLVLNALDAMPDGGTLELRASRDANEIRLVVRDSGVGMTVEVIERAFEPLFTTKGKSGGTGLGLNVSQNVVRSVNGRFEVQSQPGAGTTMTLILPAAA